MNAREMRRAGDRCIRARSPDPHIFFRMRKASALKSTARKHTRKNTVILESFTHAGRAKQSETFLLSRIRRVKKSPGKLN